MNLVRFPVQGTNIFPATNSVTGGQLLTEFNIRSRESIATPEAVQYMVGPSYAHSMADYTVRPQMDGGGTIISNTTLEITPGRALVNGHFVELLTPIVVDMQEINAKAKVAGEDPLVGELAIGLRAMYSTLPTTAGTILVEQGNEYWEGIQVVILPKDKFILPTDSPSNINRVTAHLKLANFNYISSMINNIDQNKGKTVILSPDRIGSVNGTAAEGMKQYVSKDGLNPKKLYVFAGKGTDPATGKDTWCDALESLMVWNKDPRLTGYKPIVDEAKFDTHPAGKTQLHVPHKQVDGMKDSAGKDQYYQTKVLDLPLADFNNSTSGTVDRAYTKNVKDVISKINNIYRMPNGKQRAYLPMRRNITDESKLGDVDNLPVINNNWSPGDYIVVGEDETVTMGEYNRLPSTMYIVVPGNVTHYKYDTSTTSSSVPSKFTGVELGRIEYDKANGHGDMIPAGQAPNTSDASTYLTYFNLDSKTIRGVVNIDYLVIIMKDGSTTTRYYYTPDAVSPKLQYSEYFVITGEIGLAEEDVVGGFYNVPDTQLDVGYVARDDNGHLRLLDYELLRSGVLAYQLGEDFSTPAGQTVEALQEILDDRVNSRVAFPNLTQLQSAENPNVIHITIDLSAEDTPQTLNIYNIDSRFSTSVYLHINGSANANTTINISDCEKIRIDSNVGGTPNINVFRSNIYYNSTTLDIIDTVRDMRLWYERFEASDVDLLVDNMTVREINAPIIANDLDYWNIHTPNDNHFMYALESITFGPDATIMKAGLFIRNETTANVAEGDSIITATFEIPQGTGLTYPRKRLSKQIKVTGTFVNAYKTANPTGYMTIDTNFSAISACYDPYNGAKSIEGNVAFHCRAKLITNVAGLDIDTSLDSWSSNAFHTFWGCSLT